MNDGHYDTISRYEREIERLQIKRDELKAALREAAAALEQAPSWSFIKGPSATPNAGSIAKAALIAKLREALK